jgi:3-methyladenine DNA glycosylase AlkD
MHAWTLSIQAALTPCANAENARFMKAYLRDQFECFGIQSGPRRAAVKPLFEKAKLPPLDELTTIIDELWALPEREYQMVAVDLLIKLKSRLPVSMLADLERWIITKSWWDTVDMLATHIAGSFFIRHPSETETYVDRWRQTDNIWLRRTTLLYQLKYKEKTNTSLLFDLIRENQNDKEFFIQKAIGWVLREYSKTDAKAVIQFINEHKIEGLAQREGLKWLKSQGKL